MVSISGKFPPQILQLCLGENNSQTSIEEVSLQHKIGREGPLFEQLSSFFKVILFFGTCSQIIFETR